MRKLLLLFFLVAGVAHADQRLYGNCAQGNTQVNTQGNLSTNVVIGSFPACTITVFNTGTFVLATIYGDNSRTPKGNPFTAASDGSWFFYLPSGGRVDVQMTGGIPALPTIVTLGDIVSNDVGSLTIIQLAGDLGGTASVPLVISTHITGGTNNTIPKFNAAGNVVPSACSDNGTTVTCTEPLNIGANGLTAGTGSFSGAVTGAGYTGGPISGTTVSGTAGSFSTSVTSKVIGTIRWADQFSGTDWSAKLCAADADLGATPGVIYVSTALAGNATTNCALSAQHQVYFFPGSFTCTGCSITVNNGTKLQGSGVGSTILIQGSIGTNLIVGPAENDVEISGFTFQGVVGTVSASNNSAIFLQNTVAGNISRIWIHDNRFTSWRGQGAVLLLNVNDSHVKNNSFDNNAASGIRYFGGVRGEVIGNIVHDPSSTAFNIGIMFDSTAGIGGNTYPVSTDFVVANNTLINLPNWYGIELHQGQRFAVSGNQLNNVEAGIIVSPFNASDTTTDIAITGNTVTGTNTQDSSCVNEADYGIAAVGGGVGVALITNVTIIGNEIFNANSAQRSNTEGGISIGTVTNSVVSGNLVKGGYGSGILIQGNTTGDVQVDVLNNQVSGVQVAQSTAGYCGDGMTAAGIYAIGIASSGKIDGNHLDNTTWGIRVDTSSPNLFISTSGNTFTTIGTRYPGSTIGNAAFYGTQEFNTTTSCTTTNVINNTCTTAAIGLPAGYADTSYRATCSGLSPTNLPIISTYTKSATTFTITLETTTAAAATYASFDCIVSHSGP